MVRSYKSVQDFIHGEKGNGCVLLTKETDYMNTSQLIDIQCKCSVIFKVRFNTFRGMNKRQCNECSKQKSKKYEDLKYYIEVESHSGCKLLSTEYIDYDATLKLLCSCGEIFATKLGNFKRGKTCCNVCNNKIMWNHKMVKDYIENTSDSGCKLLSENYLGMTQELHIECKCGNDFYTPFEKFRFRNRQHCKECSTVIKRNLWCFSYEEVKNFVEVESNSNCKLISTEYINSSIPLEIQCKCGNTFTTCFGYFKEDRSPRTCSECLTKYSKGEESIGRYLTSKNITFQCEYTFNDLIGLKNCPYRFDFAIFDNNELVSLIEYDGQQHYEPICFGGIPYEKASVIFETTQNHDKLKTEYCINNNIKLLRIPYWDFSCIEEILDKELKREFELSNSDVQNRLVISC